MDDNTDAADAPQADSNRWDMRFGRCITGSSDMRGDLTRERGQVNICTIFLLFMAVASGDAQAACGLSLPPWIARRACRSRSDGKFSAWRRPLLCRKAIGQKSDAQFPGGPKPPAGRRAVQERLWSIEPDSPHAEPDSDRRNRPIHLTPTTIAGKAAGFHGVPVPLLKSVAA